MTINSPIQTKTPRAKSIALSIVAMFSLAIVGLSGTTFAYNGNHNSTRGGDSPTNASFYPSKKADCKKHNGWRAYGFRNLGRCNAWVNHHGYGNGHGNGNNGGGNGYGGGSVTTPVADAKAWWNFDISGDNNVVNIVVNYIFG